MAHNCTFVECEQGSDAWKQARLGKITASRFSDVMTKGVGKETFGKTAYSYIMDLIVEEMTGQPQDDIKAVQLEWGKKHEAEARATYQLVSGNRISQVGFAIHGSYPLVGASSDGLVGDDGGIELKCPYNPTVHLQYAMQGVLPKEYVWQVQGGMWVLDRQWCDFVSYDPRMPSDKQLFILRVERDNKIIKELEERVEAFLGLLAEMTNTANAAFKRGAA